eukprot:779221-Pyramimonas_sp.AAC.1
MHGRNIGNCDALFPKEGTVPVQVEFAGPPISNPLPLVLHFAPEYVPRHVRPRDPERAECILILA